MSASRLSRGNRKENASEYRGSNKSLKFKTHRILRQADTSNLTVFDDRQIAQQLNSQLNKIEEIFKDFRKKKPERILKTRIYSTQEEILRLQESILEKDEQIKAIGEQIQKLKSVKNREGTQLGKPNFQSSEIFTLASELKGQRLYLSELIQKHGQRVASQRILNSAIKRLQKVYEEKYPQGEMSYYIFKQHYSQSKREEETEVKVKSGRVLSTRLRVETSIQPSGIVKSECSNKSLQELQDKKRITKLAIKNARKKHQNELAELNAKLQFLRDQNSLLTQKIRETQIQKLNLQTRFHLNLQTRISSRSRGSCLQPSGV